MQKDCLLSGFLFFPFNQEIESGFIDPNTFLLGWISLNEFGEVSFTNSSAFHYHQEIGWHCCMHLQFFVIFSFFSLSLLAYLYFGESTYTHKHRTVVA
jgi:hypothetical protein